METYRQVIKPTYEQRRFGAICFLRDLMKAIAKAEAEVEILEIVVLLKHEKASKLDELVVED